MRPQAVWLAALTAGSLLAAPPARAQGDRYVFLGDFRSMDRIRGGIVARGEFGAVEITEIVNIGFRLRYSFTGSFDTTSSVAVIAGRVD